MEKESKIKWEKFLSGDYDAYSWIYTTYAKLLYKYGLRFIPNQEIIEIEDVIQELFLKLYKNRNKLTTPDNIKVYLLISMKNSLLRYLEKENRYERVDPATIPFSLDISSEEKYIENELTYEQQKVVEEILNVLTPRQKEIIYYKYIQELEYEEICKLMELNYQSAQNLIHRSLKKLREQFKPEDFELFLQYLLLLFIAEF